jgi:hypothetical protein
MKNIMYSVVILSMLLLSQLGKAQITLEHTFDEYVTFQTGLVNETLNIFLDSKIYPVGSYVITNTGDNSYTVKIYNENYSLNTNKTYYFTPPSGYKLSSVSASRKLFNTDENLEFMVTYNKIESVNDNTRQKVILHDQNGGTIKDFGTTYSFSVDTYLHIVNNKFRLAVRKTFYDGSVISYKTEIYSVPGTPPAAPIITTTTLPKGTIGMEYNTILAASGDVPITWSIESGNLPNGLNLSSTGEISGMPTISEASNFIVKATNEVGSGIKELSIIIDEETGISMFQIAELKIFPNPTNDRLIVECENDLQNRLIFYDMTGKDVLSQNVEGKTEVNISSLPKGIYIVSIVSTHGVIGNFKIVKQ